MTYLEVPCAVGYIILDCSVFFLQSVHALAITAHSRKVKETCNQGQIQECSRAVETDGASARKPSPSKRHKRAEVNVTF